MAGRWATNEIKFLGLDFGLIGELFGFPSDDEDQFGSQMNYIGTHFGTILRDIYGFEKEIL